MSNFLSNLSAKLRAAILRSFANRSVKAVKGFYKVKDELVKINQHISDTISEKHDEVDALEFELETLIKMKRANEGVVYNINKFLTAPMDVEYEK